MIIIIILVMNYWQNIRDHYLGNNFDRIRSCSWSLSLSWKIFYDKTFVIIILVMVYRVFLVINNMTNSWSLFVFQLAKIVWNVFCSQLWTFDYQNVCFWTFVTKLIAFCSQFGTFCLVRQCMLLNVWNKDLPCFLNVLQRSAG